VFGAFENFTQIKNIVFKKLLFLNSAQGVEDDCGFQLKADKKLVSAQGEQIQIREKIHEIKEAAPIDKDSVAVGDTLFVSLKQKEVVHYAYEPSHYNKEKGPFLKGVVHEIKEGSILFRKKNGRGFFLLKKDADGLIFQAQENPRYEIMKYDILYEQGSIGQRTLSIHLQDNPSIVIGSYHWTTSETASKFSRFQVEVDFRQLGLSQILFNKSLEYNKEITDYFVSFTEVNGHIFRENFLQFIDHPELPKLRKAKNYIDALREFFVDFVTKDNGENWAELNSKFLEKYEGEFIKAIQSTPAYKVRSAAGINRFKGVPKLGLNFNDREDLEIEVSFTLVR